METGQRNPFSGPVINFQDSRLPEAARPVGYAALIDAFALRVPLPLTLTAIGDKHRSYTADGWRILTPRHLPEPTLIGQLTFALRHEGVDLIVLKCLFQATGPRPIEAAVATSPTGAYTRRIWFLYEWLLRARLDLPDADAGRYAPVIDPDLQIATEGETVSRQRVRNNLPGTSAFCPLVFRTAAVNEFQALDLQRRASETVAHVPKDVLARTAAFLLLQDSKASYAIEGETPAQDRIHRWGQAIAQAGRRPLDLDELLRLQRLVIGDQRFVRLGLRTQGGFVGMHDRESRMPVPDHISARHQDLPQLIEGLLQFDQTAGHRIDPVIAAAILAFGFVYIHPFEDGNGRLHRYLIHHSLGQRHYSPPGVVFPISAAILHQADDYRSVLESYSNRLLPLIDWQPTDTGNVDILNDTADFYRYFDATPHVTFLYACVRRTIETDIPQEAAWLASRDRAMTAIMNQVEMPDRMADLLILFVRQNGGRLAKRRRENEFAALTDQEVTQLEGAINRAFDA